MFDEILKELTASLPVYEKFRIRFKGREYLLIGSKTQGVIATKEQYENFELSFAYLYPDGIVYRHNLIIGTRKDIDFLEE